MPLVRRGRRARSGAALVETAAVLVIFLMILFGVFEYCRLLFMKQLIDNAAREGARYAVVNTTDPNLIASTQAVINTKMGGFSNYVLNWNVQVYRADISGNPVYDYQSDKVGNYVTDGKGAKNYIQFDAVKNQNYVIDPSLNKVYFTLDTKTTSITDASGAFSTYASANGVTLTDTPTNAAFGQYIAVQIDCDYNPIVPNMLRLNQTVHLRTKAFMYSEAN